MGWRRRTALVCVAVLVAAVGGSARPTESRPDDIQATSAMLRAPIHCRAETTTNPCTYWFQYWQDGATAVRRTDPIVANVRTDGEVEVQQLVTGLTPETMYHAQLCGHGDRVLPPPGICVGLTGGAISLPGNRPDPGDYNATRRFRTAGPTTRGTADLGRPLSTADTATNPISRDGGFSAAYSATHSLWLFGDTGQRNGPPFLAGTTAALGPFTRGQVPTALEELPTPPAAPAPGRTAPAPFLPAPRGLLTPDTPPTRCGTNRSYAASWPGGLARVPGTSRVLIVYAEVCIGIDRDWPTERLTLVEYDPATNRFLSTGSPFVAAPLQAGIPTGQRLGSPVFGDDGFLYLFGSDMKTDMVFVARVPAEPSAWRDGARYRWWGRPAGENPQWTGDHTAITSIARVDNPWGIHVTDFTGVGPHRLAMVVQTAFGTGNFQLFEAGSPVGVWRPGPAGRVPDTCVGTFGCYAFSGHAELSTPDRFVVSWYSGGDRSGHGHVRLATITW